MKIIQSKDLFGNDIVTVIDELNDKAESMTKATYDEQQAHLTESVTKAK